MFYSAKHMDDGTLMATGRNSKTKKELKQDLAEMLAETNDGALSTYSKASLETLLDCLDCELCIHNDFVPDNMDMVENDCV